MSILDVQLKQGLVYSGLPQFKNKVEYAKRDIVAMLDKFPRSYVSVSWGKQSIILAHLVWCIDKTIPAVHWGGEDSDLIGDFENVKQQFLSRYPMEYVEMIRETKLREAILEFEKVNSYQGAFIGLCAYESKGRTYTIKNSNWNNIFIRKDGTARSCPLGLWTQDDIAAYLAINQLPLLSPYHRFGLDIRTSTGSRKGSYTERAVDFMNSINAAEMRRRWEQK